MTIPLGADFPLFPAAHLHLRSAAHCAVGRREFMNWSLILQILSCVAALVSTVIVTVTFIRQSKTEKK